MFHIPVKKRLKIDITVCGSRFIWNISCLNSVEKNWMISVIVLTSCVACFRQNPSTVDGCSWHLKEQTLTILCTDHGFVWLHGSLKPRKNFTENMPRNMDYNAALLFYLTSSFWQKCLTKTIFRHVLECAVSFSSAVLTCTYRGNLMDVGKKCPGHISPQIQKEHFGG